MFLWQLKCCLIAGGVWGGAEGSDRGRWPGLPAYPESGQSTAESGLQSLRHLQSLLTIHSIPHHTHSCVHLCFFDLWQCIIFFSLFSHYFHHISPPSILLLIPFIFLKANILWNFAGFRKWVPSRGRAQSWLLSQVKGLVHLFVWGWPSTPSDRPALLPWWLCVSSWVHRWYVPARFYSHLGKSGFVRVRQNYYICSCKMFICKTVSLFRKFYSKFVWLKVFWTPSAWMCCWCLSRRRRIQIFSHLDSISMVKSIGHWMRT